MLTDVRVDPDANTTTIVVGGFAEPHEVEQLRQLIHAWDIFRERERERQGQWRGHGLKGQVYQLYCKAERAQIQANRGQHPNADHFLDTINFAAFALRLLEDPDLDTYTRMHGHAFSI